MRRLSQLGRLSNIGTRTSSSSKSKTGKSIDIPSIKSVAPPPSEAATDINAQKRQDPLIASQPFPFPPKGTANEPQIPPLTSRQQPLGPGTGGSQATPRGGKGPTDKKGNLWPLRLLTVGAAAAGGYVIYQQLEEVQDTKPAPGSQSKISLSSKQPSSSVDSEISQGASQESHGPEKPVAMQSDFYSDELALQAGSSGMQTIAEAAREVPEEIALQEVEEPVGQRLSPADAEAHSQAVADVLSSVLTSQIQVVDAEVEQDRLRDTLEHEPQPLDTGSIAQDARQQATAQMEEASERRKESERKLQETLSVLKENVADTSGEALLSSASSYVRSSKRPHESKLEEPDEASMAEKVGPGNSREEDGSGIDLRPAALMRKAIERGEGSGDNWAEYQQRLKQAESDAVTFAAAEQEALQAKQEEIGKLQREIEHRDQLLQQAEANSRETVAKFQGLMRDQERALAEQKQEDLRKQAEASKRASVEALVKERATRGGTLDQIRLKLNSLAQAFSHRSDESATSHSVHKLSLGVFALEDALQQGSPFSDQKTVLLTSCSDDRLVDLAVQSLPNDISNKGVATRAQLLHRWPDISKLSSQLAYLPPGQTGFLQLGLATLASKLKVKEAIGQDGTSIDTVDQALAQAEANLVRGRYAEAARSLEQGLSGTAAQVAVSDWIAELRARATADQAVKLLQAHASAQAASVS